MLPPLKPLQYFKSSVGKQYASARASSERGLGGMASMSNRKLGGKNAKKELSVVSVPLRKNQNSEQSQPEVEYFPSAESTSMLRSADRAYTGRSLPSSESKMQILRNRYSKGKPLMVRVRNPQETNSHNISEFSNHQLDSPRKKKKTTIEQRLTKLFSPKANESLLSSSPQICEVSEGNFSSPRLDLTK